MTEWLPIKLYLEDRWQRDLAHRAVVCWPLLESSIPGRPYPSHGFISVLPTSAECWIVSANQSIFAELQTRTPTTFWTLLDISSGCAKITSTLCQTESIYFFLHPNPKPAVFKQRSLFKSRIIWSSSFSFISRITNSHPLYLLFIHSFIHCLTNTSLYYYLHHLTWFFLTSLLEYNCFTMVCQFLLYNKVNQLYIYIYPHISSLLRLPPSHPPYPTPLGGHKTLSWSPCAMRLLPTSYLFYIW